MNFLALMFVLELGLLPCNEWVMYESEIISPEAVQWYTHLEGEVEIGELLFIGGAVTTRMEATSISLGGFVPFTDEYRFTLGFRFGPMEAGLRHMCTHPVIPLMLVNDPEVITYEGSYEELYIRFELASE
jgi:hypothetical protein